MPTPISSFPSVAEAVASLMEQGYKTVIPSTANGDRIMMRKYYDDVVIVRHVGLLNAEVYQDQGYWEDKLADYASDYYG